MENKTYYEKYTQKFIDEIVEKSKNGKLEEAPSLEIVGMMIKSIGDALNDLDARVTKLEQK